MKVSSGYANPRDIINIKNSLKNLPSLKALLKNTNSDLLKNAIDNIYDLSTPYQLIEDAIVENPPLRISDTGVFKKGYNDKLDEIRAISYNSKTWIANYQNTLREKLNIKTLKIGFTRVFGYYIDVSKGQANKVPNSFHKRQTLVNNERFISDELKEFEQKVLSAEENIKSIENCLYQDLIQQLSNYFEKINIAARSIAIIDCMTSLAL